MGVRVATHAFYTLNDELPAEAQVAIRSFPSTNAATIGLLSRGETLEVVARSGSWLQLATAHDNDSDSESDNTSWIMWETDAWRLLVEAVDYSATMCSTQPGAVGTTLLPSAEEEEEEEVEAAADDKVDDSVDDKVDSDTDDMDGMQLEATDAGEGDASQQPAEQASSALEPPSESVVTSSEGVELAGDRADVRDSVRCVVAMDSVNRTL